MLIGHEDILFYRDVNAVWMISFKIRAKIDIHVKEHLSVCFCRLCALEEHFSTASYLQNFAFISLKSTIEETKLIVGFFEEKFRTPLFENPSSLEGCG